MGSLPPKKAAAIAAAVLQHLCATRSPAALPALASRAEPAVREQIPPLPLWSLGGRQQAMQDRLTWQRRLGKSW